MSAATAESTALAPDEMVATPRLSVLYASRRANLRLVKKPIRPVRNVEGMQTDLTDGETVAFKDGRLEIPVDAPLQLEKGERVDAEEIVKWLEGHKLNGDMEDGFWKVNLAAPEPTKAELDRLVALAVAGDIPGLEGFIAAEEAGWARETLLPVAQETLGTVKDRQAQVDAQMAQARADGEAAAAGSKPLESTPPVKDKPEK